MMKKCQADIAYEYSEGSLINKVFFPGNRLIEEDLVRETGVSRTSVRTALNRLRYEGIVEGTPNRGMMVTRFHPNDIKSVFQIRESLEVGAFSLAIERISPAAVDRMREYNGELRKVSENFSISDFVKYNRPSTGKSPWPAAIDTTRNIWMRCTIRSPYVCYSIIPPWMTSAP